MHPSEIYNAHSHTFNQGIAKHLGIQAAVVFSHIVYWLQVNARKKDVEMFDEKYWMYETQKEIADFFGYLSEDDVQRALKKLVASGLIIKGNFNKNSFDRTSWYTVYDQDLVREDRPIKKVVTKPQICGMDSAPMRNGNRKFADSLYTIEKQEDNHKKNINTPPTPNGDSAIADGAVDFSSSSSKEKSKTPEVSAQSIELAKQISEKMTDLNKTYTPAKPQLIAKHLDLILKNNNVTPKDIIDVVEWALEHHIWHAALYKPNVGKYLQLKFTQIFAQMNSPKPKVERKFAIGSDDKKAYEAIMGGRPPL